MGVACCMCVLWRIRRSGFQAVACLFSHCGSVSLFPLWSLGPSPVPLCGATRRRSWSSLLLVGSLDFFRATGASEIPVKQEFPASWKLSTPRAPSVISLQEREGRQRLSWQEDVSRQVPLLPPSAPGLSPSYSHLVELPPTALWKHWNRDLHPRPHTILVLGS